MMTLWLLLTLVSVTQNLVKSDHHLVRMCVPSSLATSCAEMVEDLPDTFDCVFAPDTFGCLEKISSGEADITNVDANGLYLAGKFFNLKSVVTELVDGEPYRYQGIALVSKEDPSIQSAKDLKGKRSCHTGFWRTVGWQIPIGKLLAENIMEPDCEDGELAAASNFFSGGCLAGNWSSDHVTDVMMKGWYPNLCSQCKDPAACSQDDLYYGYEGAIKCLVDGQGDVGFTKIPILKEYLAMHPELAEQAELLCFDGGRKSVNDQEPCVWGERPTNTFVSRANSEEEILKMVTALLNTQTRYSVPQVRIPQWYYKSFLSHPKVSGIRRTVEDRMTYTGYLGEFIHTIRKPRPGCNKEQHDAKYCATSDPEERKCQDYSKVAESRGMWPNIRCVRAASKAACMKSIKKGDAHMVVLDAADAYKAGRYNDLAPLAAEIYNGSDATYYAVAVLRSVSEVSKLSELKGVRSCHTGMGRTAGWVMPVGALVSESLLTSEEGVCNYANAVADFFSGGSCVPGANNTKYNPDRVRSDDLCKQCVGDEEGQHRCARDSSERYSGYGGAFRCLVEGKGDVAFVRHSTVSEYTDGQGKAPWAKDLSSSDFKLLCSGGGIAPVSEYLNCNIGKVPSRFVMVGPGVWHPRRCHLSQIMADTSRYFGPDSKLYNIFHKKVNSDVIFKDSTTSLRVTTSGLNYNDVLGSHYLETLTAVGPKAC